MFDPLNGYWDVTVRAPLVTMRRTEKRSDDVAAFARSFGGVYDLLEGGTPEQMRLLLDIRISVGRNDPKFEAALAEPRRELFRQFGNTAVIVRTAVGRLQVARHIEDDGFAEKVRLFVDADESLEWLRSV